MPYWLEWQTAERPGERETAAPLPLVLCCGVLLRSRQTPGLCRPGPRDRCRLQQDSRQLTDRLWLRADHRCLKSCASRIDIALSLPIYNVNAAGGREKRSDGTGARSVTESIFFLYGQPGNFYSTT